MVEPCGELHLLISLCCLPHTRQPLGHAYPALCRLTLPCTLHSACNDSVGALIARFRSSMPSPPIPLFMLRHAPCGTQRKTRGRAVRYSFLVRLFHSLLHAGLSRRSITPIRCYYGPSRHRLAFTRFSGLAGYASYLAPPISRWNEDGFSRCLACPCLRAVPTTPPK